MSSKFGEDPLPGCLDQMGRQPAPLFAGDPMEDGICNISFENPTRPFAGQGRLGPNESRAKLGIWIVCFGHGSTGPVDCPESSNFVLPTTYR